MGSTAVHTCGNYSTNVHAHRPRSIELGGQIDGQPRVASADVAKYYLITETEPELIHCASCKSDNLSRATSGKFTCLTCGEGGQDFGGSIEIRKSD
jgi:hypothetical protein